MRDRAFDHRLAQSLGALQAQVAAFARAVLAERAALDGVGERRRPSADDRPPPARGPSSAHRGCAQAPPLLFRRDRACARETGGDVGHRTAATTGEEVIRGPTEAGTEAFPVSTVFPVSARAAAVTSGPKLIADHNLHAPRRGRASTTNKMQDACCLPDSPGLSRSRRGSRVGTTPHAVPINLALDHARSTTPRHWTFRRPL